MTLNEAIKHCEEIACKHNACALEHKQLEKWLIELKELKEKKPWGEEDEQMYNTIANSLNRDQVERVWNTTVDEVIDWLKSLRPQSTWKPSDEQIKALKEACDKHWEPDGLDPLYILWEQLKKLKEE